MSKCITSLQDDFNVVYYPNFLNVKDADEYFNILENELVYNSKEQSKIKIYGKDVYIPRSQTAYGEPGTHYTFSKLKVYANSWNADDNVCKVIKNIKHKIELFTGKQFNFVLINRYKDGSDYIGFHSDDEKELGTEPTIAGISLGSERYFQFKPRKFDPVKIEKNFKILLEHGSFVSMNHHTNEHWYHGIPKNTTVKTPRISLTFRYLHL
jgi:alkylated DNA repair dioxygenase AlkB